MSRNKYVPSLIVPVVALLAFSLPVASIAAAPPAADRAAVLETKMALRDLWVEHVFWIRNYVLATHAHDSAQAKAAEQEVVANAKALSAAIIPFYGQAASDSLFKLLAGHWTAVRDYNSAALAKSKPDQEKASAGLVNNAREIAKFLSSANPDLPQDAVFGLLSAHGAHHIAQIDGITGKDFASEAATWRAMRSHMLMISDAITDALAKQFPARFGGQS